MIRHKCQFICCTNLCFAALIYALCLNSQDSLLLILLKIFGLIPNYDFWFNKRKPNLPHTEFWSDTFCCCISLLFNSSIQYKSIIPLYKMSKHIVCLLFPYLSKQIYSFSISALVFICPVFWLVPTRPGYKMYCPDSTGRLWYFYPGSAEVQPVLQGGSISQFM